MKGTIGIIATTLAIAFLFASCQEDLSQSTGDAFREAVQQQASEQQAAKKQEARKQAARQKAARQKAARQKAARQKAARQKAAQKKAARKSPSITTMLRALPVRNEQEAGYDRDAFEHWSDLDGNGCDTREDVLRAENRQPRGNVCWDERGLWYSAYDGQQTRDSGSFDVDHVVPLAEAWDSGAGRWTETRREQYANDFWPLSLRAVTAASNRSKSDQDPADWMPPLGSFHCRYLLEWVAVKYRWRLGIDPVERLAILDEARDCPQASLPKLPPRA